MSRSSTAPSPLPSSLDRDEPEPCSKILPAGIGLPSLDMVAEDIDPAARTFFMRVLAALTEAQIPYLVGGAFALMHYAGILRRTKDLDIFVRRRDAVQTLAVLTREGYDTCLTFPHWLGKAFSGSDYVDVIFSSGNGLAEVDDAWFEHQRQAEVFGLPVGVCPPEEMIWAKAFIMERERFDGADVAHLLRAMGEDLDWPRLLERFGDHWRVLLSQLVLFGFIYPAECNRVPAWVMRELMGRLEAETASPPPADRVCRGTLLSRAQYIVDVDEGYGDARLFPAGSMTPEEIAHWTAAIDTGKSHL